MDENWVTGRDGPRGRNPLAVCRAWKKGYEDHRQTRDGDSTWSVGETLVTRMSVAHMTFAMVSDDNQPQSNTATGEVLGQCQDDGRARAAPSSALATSAVGGRDRSSD